MPPEAAGKISGKNFMKSLRSSYADSLLLMGEKTTSEEVVLSNLTRWESVREMTLREAMDRLFDDAFTRPLARRDG